MEKEERIGRYGEATYEKWLQQSRGWNAQWREANPDKVAANNQEANRKGGKYYKKHLKHEHIGLRGERNKIRTKHANRYRPFKQIIAPNSQIHHEWIPNTAEYAGVALVEKDQHMHGYVDVIKILDGKITLFTEKEIREQKGDI